MIGLDKLLGGVGQGASNMFTAGGAAIGDIADYAGNVKRMNRQQGALERAAGRNEDVYNQIASMYDPYTEAGAQALSDLQAEYSQMKSATPQEFTPDMVNKWLDPSINFQMDQANMQMKAQQAASGDYLSSGAQQQMLEQNRKMAETGYGDARNFGYGVFQNKLAQHDQDLNTRLNLLNNLNQQGFNATGNMANARSQYGDQGNQLLLSKDLVGAEQSALKSGLLGNLGQTGMNLGAADSQTFSNMFGGGTQGATTQGMISQGQTPTVGTIGQTPAYNQQMFGTQQPNSTSLTASGLNMNLMDKMGGAGINFGGY